MPVCIAVQVIGTSDGPRAVIVPSDPQQGCAYVALTQSEAQTLLDAQPASSPFNLSVEDGFLVSGAVASVWCMAWAIRAIRSVLSDRDND